MITSFIHFGKKREEEDTPKIKIVSLVLKVISTLNMPILPMSLTRKASDLWNLCVSSVQVT